MHKPNDEQQEQLFSEQIQSEQQKIAEKLANETNPYKKMAYQLQYKYVERKPEVYFSENNGSFDIKKAYEELTAPLI